MPKYGKTASKKVAKTMHEMKTGTLRSGRSGKPVKSRKQAIAIGLSEARRATTTRRPATASFGRSLAHREQQLLGRTAPR